jgi:NAD(P)-dependent dehydrogenase (short-subunit alcohol dehydrogenase family)
MPRTWMITGTSTGFGRDLTLACLDAGDAVVATARDAGSIADLGEGRPGALLPLALDVTDPASVTRAVDDALAWSGGVDVLVNNAGHGFAGAFEELTDAQFRGVLEVNLFGVAAVTRALLPSMRARGRGHLVQMSSVGGVRGNAGHGVYAASKFALEGLSEALAAELAPFGIRVTIVEPGPFRTDFAGRSMGYADPLDAYEGTPAAATRARFATQDGTQLGDPVRAVAAIRAVVDDPDAPRRLPLGSVALTVLEETYRARLDDLARTADRARSADFVRA